MAAASQRKVLEEIGEDFLCCTICLEQFKSPKILPCLHTFCEQCLVTLVEKIGSLTCPECRKQYQLPVGGVPAIKGTCLYKLHHSQTPHTRRLIHRDVKDAADEYLTELKTMVDKLKVKEQETKRNKTLAKQIHTDLTEQYSREERKVRMKAEGIIKKIKREEQRLIDELKNNYKMKIKRAAVDIDEMELKHGNIKSAGSYIETLMHHGNASQLLSTKGDVCTRIKQLITMEIIKTEYEDLIFTPHDEHCFSPYTIILWSRKGMESMIVMKKQQKQNPTGCSLAEQL
ncbi:tripartite motif-containing protein 2-like [Ptychodera flava]|uniref:tripartite motif-containing protein 2-like n=1 Tax=Ptychodera flava TaxID=63121 RepID=UPI003969BB65